MPPRKPVSPPRRRSSDKPIADASFDISRFDITALLAWYRQAKRDLPWRPTPHRPANPYHILVSEAMLQQTQVATVVPYFQRFIDAFPDVHALANADEQRVLALWQGLGYYRRARNLHASARMMVERFGGQVPSTVEDLVQLPGVGRYTAGAVASIAHRKPAPIVDGNVARVLARHFLLAEPVDQPATLKKLWHLAEALVSTSTDPRDFNQAMMELGALVCTPRSPRCVFCPLQASCAALASGRVNELPVKSPKKKPSHVTHLILAVQRPDGKYLFTQRPATGLWANMWQLLTFDEVLPDGSAITQRVLSDLAMTIAPPRHLRTFSHQTTHRTVRFEVYGSQTLSTSRKHLPGRTRWCGLDDDLEDLPLSVPQRKAVEILRGMDARPPGTA